MGAWKSYLAELEEKGEVWKALQKLEKARDKIKKLVCVKKDKGLRKKANITQQERNKAL